MDKAGFALELILEIAAVEIGETARKVGEGAALALDAVRHPVAYYVASRERKALAKLDLEEQMHYLRMREEQDYELL